MNAVSISGLNYQRELDLLLNNAVFFVVACIWLITIMQ